MKTVLHNLVLIVVMVNFCTEILKSLPLGYI